MYHQERDVDELWYDEGKPEYEFGKYEKMLKSKWDENCTYYEHDFLSAVLTFRNMSIQDALYSDDFIIKALAIMDKRVGKRTLKKIEDSGNYLDYPDWVKQFFLLRLSYR